MKKTASKDWKAMLFSLLFPAKDLQKNSPKVFIISLVIISFLGFLCMDNGHNWADDFAMYLSQCQALQNGSMKSLFEANRLSMDNSYGNVGPYLYPNGFPILLVPVYVLFGVNFWAFKIYCWLFFIAGLIVLFFILKQEEFENKYALTISLLVGFNYHYIRFSDYILSDFPYFFFSLLSLFFILKKYYQSLIQALSLGSLIFFSYHIRDIGILLFVCLIFKQFEAIKNKKTSFGWLTILPYFVFLVLWFIRYQRSSNMVDRHLDFLASTNLEIIANNLYYYGLLIGNYFVVFQGISAPFQVFISLFFIIIILVGIFKNRTKNLAILIYLWSSFGLYFLWVSFQGMRFIFPLIPFLLYYFILGLKQLLQQEKRVNWVLSCLLWTSLAQSLLISYYYHKTDTNECYTEDLQKIYQYIAKELPQEAIIVFEKPRALRFFSGRNAVQKDIITAKYALVTKTKISDNILFQTASYSLIYNNK